MNNKIEDFLDGIKLGELLNRHENEHKKDNKCMVAIVVCGVVAIVAILSFTVYKLITPRLKNRRHFDDFNDFYYDCDDDDFDFDFENDDYSSDDEN